jgi:hypothetical protein
MSGLVWLVCRGCQSKIIDYETEVAMPLVFNGNRNSAGERGNVVVKTLHYKPHYALRFTQPLTQKNTRDRNKNVSGDWSEVGA